MLAMEEEMSMIKRRLAECLQELHDARANEAELEPEVEELEEELKLRPPPAPTTIPGPVGKGDGAGFGRFTPVSIVQPIRKPGSRVGAEPKLEGERVWIRWV